MAKVMTPEQLAKKIRDYARVGWDFNAVQAFKRGLEADKQDSRDAAPKKEGRLARTIRITVPTVSRIIRSGFARFGLLAGSTSKANPVPQASVLQLGTVGFPPEARTKAHQIPSRPAYDRGRLPKAGEFVPFGRSGAGVMSFRAASGKALKLPFGTFRSVSHPGSRFRGRSYLKVLPDRLASYVKYQLTQDIQQAFDN